jgi:hypothetical protein
MDDFLTRIARENVQEFIASNENADVQALVLAHREIHGVPSAWIATQIQGRRKAREKLPLWYRTPGIVYPPALGMEQCSTELTARYKQQLVHGHQASDLSAGFGVDAFFLSQSFDRLEYVEPEPGLLELARHNHILLGAENIGYHGQSADAFLNSDNAAFDLIFLDPSRRQGQRRVYHLGECAPNVVALKNTLLKKSLQVLIKASPLLDLKQAQRELGVVDQFIVLAVENECKEILIHLRRDPQGRQPTIHAVHLDRDGVPTPFAFTWEQEKYAKSTYGSPLTYVYEPNAAILKSGAFKLIGERYELTKLAPDTHLYTSEEQKPEFPGRLFRVIEEVSLHSKLHEQFENGYANILTRNYPMSVPEILSKTGLKEGGQHYLICTRSEKPLVMVAERLR